MAAIYHHVGNRLISDRIEIPSVRPEVTHVQQRRDHHGRSTVPAASAREGG